MAKTELKKMAEEMEAHLTERMLPFWEGLLDKEHGGFYGAVNADLKIQKEAVKGGILNSRILWFFSNAADILEQKECLIYAKQAYEFLRDVLWDKEQKGIYWSVTFDGKPADTVKHTYNQAFAVYGLSAYYRAAGVKEALSLAWQLFDLMEEKCCDEEGYLEAFNRDFTPAGNDKLSENGVMAEKTMNTLLHVFEAYTELYRVTKEKRVADRMRFMLDIVAGKIFNPELKRQEVFFDSHMNSILDLHSYGHDIETAWLVDWGLNVLGDPVYTKKITPVMTILAENVYDTAFEGTSLYNECCRGIVDKRKIWWVQAETVLGFLNEYEKSGDGKYLEAAEKVWDFIQDKVVDKRENSDWFGELDSENQPDRKAAMVDMWKCPYHNGRMCMEVIRRFRKA